MVSDFCGGTAPPLFHALRQGVAQFPGPYSYPSRGFDGLVPTNPNGVSEAWPTDRGSFSCSCETRQHHCFVSKSRLMSDVKHSFRPGLLIVAHQPDFCLWKKTQAAVDVDTLRPQ
jgi:hypothetical protein